MASLLNVAGSLPSMSLANWITIASSMDSIGEHWPNRDERMPSRGFVAGLIRLICVIILAEYSNHRYRCNHRINDIDDVCG